MAVACGHNCTFVVTQQGALFAFGKGSNGQLGLASKDDQAEPTLVASATLLDSPVCMVAAGEKHGFCLTTTGSLFSWGSGILGQLGHGDYVCKTRPTELGKQICAGAKIQMVSCGQRHTMVLTDIGSVWTCGDGFKGKLGHGDVTNHCTFVQVLSTGCNAMMPCVSMVVAGLDHSVALASDGRVFSWGCALEGKLGLYHPLNPQYNTKETRPMLVESLQKHRVHMAAAGNDHTVVLTLEGIILTWGAGCHGQLGLGGRDDRHIPEQIDAGKLMGGAKISVVSCQNARTALLTTGGVLYTCGRAISAADPDLAAGDVVYANKKVNLHT